MARGQATKSRWAACEEAALALGVTKVQVFYYMYDDLIQAELLERVRNCDALAIAKAKELPGYTRILAEKQIRIHDESSTSDGSENLAQKLGIAIWFIKKAGGIEGAEKLLKAAKAAMNTLRKEE